MPGSGRMGISCGTARPGADKFSYPFMPSPCPLLLHQFRVTAFDSIKHHFLQLRREFDEIFCFCLGRRRCRFVLCCVAATMIAVKRDPEFARRPGSQFQSLKDDFPVAFGGRRTIAFRTQCGKRQRVRRTVRQDESARRTQACATAVAQLVVCPLQQSADFLGAARLRCEQFCANEICEVLRA